MVLRSTPLQNQIQHKQCVTTWLQRLAIMGSRLINFPMCRADIQTNSLANSDANDNSPVYLPPTAILQEEASV